MTGTNDDVALDAALDPLVLALDIGSTATRGGVHDASGRRVHGLQHKVPHAFTVAPDGTSIIDPEQVTAGVEQVLDAVTGDPRLRTRIAGVAMDTFAASLIAVAEAAHWWSLGEYILPRLIGHPLAGMSTVAWTGPLDRRTGELDAELLSAADVVAEQFSPQREESHPGALTASASRRYGPVGSTGHTGSQTTRSFSAVIAAKAGLAREELAVGCGFPASPTSR